jgi:alcohol dehydrogenase YqhD (iron-dependent ADH family)
MLGEFTYHNPTIVHFGEHALERLPEELAKFGKSVVLVYGGGSIKRNGIYDQVIKILKEAGKDVTEISGVMSNPTSDKLVEGVSIARPAHPDLILGVGGGSVIDYSKALAVSVNYDGDPWEKYYLRWEEPDCPIVPVGAVLTMAGTGSEMNKGAVITNPHTHIKLGHVYKSDEVFPKFAIMNPRFTMTLPHYQMVAGIYDIFNHICEQYFSGEDDNSSDYISEGLMRSVIKSSRIANKKMDDYEARSNIMWDASWALNGLVNEGKTEDWMVHMMGQSVGGLTNATHGMTLSAVSLPYYRYIMPYGLPKFVRFAEVVWDVRPDGKSDEEIANEGLIRMEAWMKELGLAMNITELGCSKKDIPALVEGTKILTGGYKALTKEEIAAIFERSL